MKRSFQIKSATVVLLALAGMSLPTSAFADPIFIDFGPNDNTTGSNWNNFSPGSAIGGGSGTNVALTDSTGSTADGITLTFDFTSSVFSAVGVAPINPALPDFPLTAVSDSVWTSSGTDNTISFSGFDTSKQYEWTISGARNAPIRFTDYTLEGLVSQTQRLDSSTTAVFNGTPEVPAPFTVFSSVIPDALGTVTLNFQGGGTSNGYLGAIKIAEAVPEPGSLALLAAGGLMIGLRRRKK